MTHADYAALLERVFKRWPDMRRYADTARMTVETLYIDGQRVRLECVTVTVFDKRAERKVKA